MLGVPSLFKKDSWFITVVNSEYECLLKLYRYNKIAAPDYGFAARTASHTPNRHT